MALDALEAVGYVQVDFICKYLSVARYGAQSRGGGSEDDVLSSSLLIPLTSLLPSERETNNKPLFLKCHLPGLKASWTEMERVNQRWLSVPRLSGPWCQSLCAGRAEGPVSPAGEHRPSTQTPRGHLPPCPECHGQYNFQKPPSTDR